MGASPAGSVGRGYGRIRGTSQARTPVDASTGAALVTEPDPQHVDQREPKGRGRPDEPIPVEHRDGGSAEPQDVTSDETEAHLAERGEGANEEKIGDGLLREDDTAPGVDPDEADA